MTSLKYAADLRGVQKFYDLCKGQCSVTDVWQHAYDEYNWKYNEILLHDYRLHAHAAQIGIKYKKIRLCEWIVEHFGTLFMKDEQYNVLQYLALNTEGRSTFTLQVCALFQIPSSMDAAGFFLQNVVPALAGRGDVEGLQYMYTAFRHAWHVYIPSSHVLVWGAKHVAVCEWILPLVPVNIELEYNTVALALFYAVAFGSLLTCKYLHEAFNFPEEAIRRGTAPFDYPTALRGSHVARCLLHTLAIYNKHYIICSWLKKTFNLTKADVDFVIFRPLLLLNYSM